MKNEYKKYWWLTTNTPELNTAFINRSDAKKFTDYRKLKSILWVFYRSKLDSRKLTARDKIVLWCIIEKFRYSSFSCNLSNVYISKMCGMNRHSVSKAISSLVDNKIIWIAIEGDKPAGLTKLKPQERIKKHYVLINLGSLMAQSLDERK